MNTNRALQPSTTVAPEGAWFKSTYSDGTGNNCVEAADLAPQIAVRDSKDKQGPALVFPCDSWNSFVSSLSQGEIALDARA
ncbi:DUF397 domain-containing protein [Streptomyces halstedii]|uniref:DUF397 domain-containing protein n=1 Tax=Streptomyces halstedii TaxID=1944 RepID=A0A6N9U9K7_STRHA|nr:DUF397 domain-containing protein [Streptomyces halstedii]